jgi:dTDP-3-amino-3,4,6-trideoxy-alpha-D-glucose transaminase
MGSIKAGKTRGPAVRACGPHTMTDMIPQAAPGLRVLRHLDAIQSAVARVLHSGRYVLGPETEAFETEFAAALNLPHVVGVNSATDALCLALEALGVGRGDEVLVPALTAAPTAIAVRRIGALPVFVDVEPKYRGLDPALISSATTARTAAVIVVHLHGIPALIAEAVAVARKLGLAVIEDCAQAHGARTGDRMVGTFGDAAAFSFYPTKNLGAVGDGGAVATRSADVAARVRRGRSYGMNGDGICMEPGFNSRLDEIQAAILRVLLPHLEEENRQRRRFAGFYDGKFASLAAQGLLDLPASHEGAAYHQYAIAVGERDDLKRRLRAAGIATGVHYEAGLHRHGAFADQGTDKVARSFPVTESLARRLLSLPIQPDLEPYRERIATTLVELVGARSVSGDSVWPT